MIAPEEPSFIPYEEELPVIQVRFIKQHRVALLSEVTLIQQNRVGFLS